MMVWLTLLVAIGAIGGIFFHPIWLGLLAFLIYFYASRESRRDKMVESRVKAMLKARVACSTFPELYFEAAQGYARAKGSAGPDDEDASTKMIVNGDSYFVVFLRERDGGTTITVKDTATHEREMRQLVEAFLPDAARENTGPGPIARELLQGFNDTQRGVQALPRQRNSRGRKVKEGFERLVLLLSVLGALLGAAIGFGGATEICNDGPQLLRYLSLLQKIPLFPIGGLLFGAIGFWALWLPLNGLKWVVLGFFGKESRISDPEDQQSREGEDAEDEYGQEKRKTSSTLLRVHLVGGAIVLVCVAVLMGEIKEQEMSAEKTRSAIQASVVLDDETVYEPTDASNTGYAGDFLWQKHDSGKALSGDEAYNYCNQLVQGDHSNWRLPDFSNYDRPYFYTYVAPNLSFTQRDVWTRDIHQSTYFGGLVFGDSDGYVTATERGYLHYRDESKEYDHVSAGPEMLYAASDTPHIGVICVTIASDEDREKFNRKFREEMDR